MSTQQDKQTLRIKFISLGIAFEEVYAHTEQLLRILHSLSRFHPPIEEKGYGELLNVLFFGKQERSERKWRIIVEKHIFDYCPASVESIDDIKTAIDCAANFLYVPRATLPWDSNLVEKIDARVATLSERSAVVIRRRFGLCSQPKESVEEIARKLHCTKKQLQSIEGNALRTLRCLKQDKSLKTLIATWSEAINYLEEKITKEQATSQRLRVAMLEDGNIASAVLAIDMEMPLITVNRK